MTLSSLTNSTIHLSIRSDTDSRYVDIKVSWMSLVLLVWLWVGFTTLLVVWYVFGQQLVQIITSIRRRRQQQLRRRHQRQPQQQTSLLLLKSDNDHDNDETNGKDAVDDDNSDDDHDDCCFHENSSTCASDNSSSSSMSDQNIIKKKDPSRHTKQSTTTTITQPSSSILQLYMELFTIVVWGISTTYGVFYCFYVIFMYVNDRWYQLLALQSFLFLTDFIAWWYLFGVLLLNVGGSDSSAPPQQQSRRSRRSRSLSTAATNVMVGIKLFHALFNIAMEAGTYSPRNILFLLEDVSYILLSKRWFQTSVVHDCIKWSWLLVKSMILAVIPCRGCSDPSSTSPTSPSSSSPIHKKNPMGVNDNDDDEEYGSVVHNKPTSGSSTGTRQMRRSNTTGSSVTATTCTARTTMDISASGSSSYDNPNNDDNDNDDDDIRGFQKLGWKVRCLTTILKTVVGTRCRRHGSNVTTTTIVPTTTKPKKTVQQQEVIIDSNSVCQILMTMGVCAVSVIMIGISTGNRIT